MAPLTFEEVWILLRQLKAKPVTTLVNHSRNRIVCVQETKIVREIAQPDGSWARASSVGKNTFREVWDQLTRTGFYQGRAAFASACLVSVKGLGVEWADGKSPRTIVLRDFGTAFAVDSQPIDDEDAEEFNNRNRIVVDPDICTGKPTIRGTRIMVANILGMFAGGYSINKVLKAYPELSRPDVICAVKYASWVVDREKVVA